MSESLGVHNRAIAAFPPRKDAGHDADALAGRPQVPDSFR